ncbi:transcriptional regulator with XRE-family HTH domain [Aminobacter niigataensis]|uniref:Transcriptional regulator with XRE-family HTH domain n=1 Tax=Aminobacter niigataensis TaxID=83265 RepID=A0ABR6L3W7_9HYPH|nr:cupin domain-containing protein [Aminobacter niigataensis]MBB4651500.1 transcriptional regulator with XRE-family HTH domain [Aminobacter niigataensis]
MAKRVSAQLNVGDHQDVDQRDQPPAIGIRLKHARLTKGLSLRQIADIAGCSESFVSKVEHDRVRPSLATLHRLVKALEINIAALFSDADLDESGPVFVYRAGQRPLIHMDPLRKGEGITLERLIPHARGILLQANVHIVAPNGASAGLIEHEGEEIGYVLEGELELQVEDKFYHLVIGDSFFFNSKLPHGYRNPGSVQASILWVNTPPSF